MTEREIRLLELRSVDDWGSTTCGNVIVYDMMEWRAGIEMCAMLHRIFILSSVLCYSMGSLCEYRVWVIRYIYHFDFQRQEDDSYLHFASSSIWKHGQIFEMHSCIPYIFKMLMYEICGLATTSSLFCIIMIRKTAFDLSRKRWYFDVLTGTRTKEWWERYSKSVTRIATRYTLTHINLSLALTNWRPSWSGGFLQTATGGGEPRCFQRLSRYWSSIRCSRDSVYLNIKCNDE